MNKYLVTIEFRYSDAPKYDDDLTSRSKKVTIGIHDTFDDACIDGNNLMENLESKFKLHVFPAGHTAKKERFSKNGGCFGGNKNLISNMAYLKTPFAFYAKITTLKYGVIDDIVDEVVSSSERYRDHKVTAE
tara:strand:- start:16829 stop:17224 length:396 start_codon:yes stop_codon:yes gene_type:complete